MEKLLDVAFDPVGAATRVASLPGVAFLHSGFGGYGLGRYSVLAARPRKTFLCRGGEASIREGDTSRFAGGNVFDLFAAELEANDLSVGSELPFHAGPIGYFSYDAGRSLERVALEAVAEGVVEARFLFYDGAIVFDHERGKTFLVSRSTDPSRTLSELVEIAFGSKGSGLDPFELTSPLLSNFERSEYIAAVHSIRDRIRAGDVYQVNLSQRFEARCSGSPFDLFLRLANASPAPYAAYIDFGDEQVLSSSPERFLQVKGRRATTRPIKGTRAAGRSEEESAKNAEDLAGSEKDRSELLMIVDLERNDLGRVCEPGSVEVGDLFRLEHYATVIHQTADVSGILEEGITPVDCIKAMFPGGSITGAPKIRSMQLIDELERGSRGVYTGSIGYFDVSGGVDLNVAIRTMRVSDDGLSFQVGGGIVWDSVAECEYDETLLKAKAMIRALNIENDG